jgi:hypothetical protein
LITAYCPLHGACCLDVFCCTLRVVCCIFPDACCQLSVAHFLVVVSSTLSVGSCLRAFFVACGLLPVARPTVPCPMVCAVRRLSHVASRHVGCAALRVVCCMLHNARPLLHVVAWLSPVPSCMPSVARCRVTQRHHNRRSASRRRSPLSAAVPGEARCSEDRGGRAPVCACVSVRVCVSAESVTVCLSGLLCVRRELSRQGNRINERPLPHVFDHNGWGHLPRHQRRKPRRVH